MKFIITFNDIPETLTTKSGKSFILIGRSGSFRSDEELEAIKDAGIRYIEYERPIEIKIEESESETKEGSRKKRTRRKK